MSKSTAGTFVRLCALTAAASLLLFPNFAAAQQKATIAIGISVVDVSQANNTWIPMYTKCWEKAGVNVALQLTNASAAMQTMLSAQVEFVIIGPAAAILARAKGAPIKSVYL